MKKINFEKHKSPRFEIVVQVRDNLGNPTGKTKSFSSDEPEQIEDFYQRNVGNFKTKNKKDNKKDNKKKELE